jgi:hypothetical protein
LRYITIVNEQSVWKKRMAELGELGLGFYLVFPRGGSKTRLTDAGILRPVTSRKMRSMVVSGRVLSGIRPPNDQGMVHLGSDTRKHGFRLATSEAGITPPHEGFKRHRKTIEVFLSFVSSKAIVLHCVEDPSLMRR